MFYVQNSVHQTTANDTKWLRRIVVPNEFCQIDTNDNKPNEAAYKHFMPAENNGDKRNSKSSVID